MLSPVITTILTNMAIHIPLYLVWLVGIILALATWNRNPRPSLFALLGIVAMFVFDMISIYMITIPMQLGEKGYAVANIAMVISIANVVLTILKACGWGLLLAAIFVGRKRQPAPVCQ
jgi:hypothetical protein